jgi:hypothetical protein
MIQENNYNHIQIASKSDVENATRLAGEIMKILADSLVTNWEDHYKLKDGSWKAMLSVMRGMLRTDNVGQVEIPVYKLRDGEAPKLYTIDYSVLYDNDAEGAKYIHDPFPALIKAAVNLSAFVNKQKSDEEKKKCKLLPACSCSSDEESVYSVDIVERFDRLVTIVPEKTAPELIGCEVEVHGVSDDDEDEEQAEQKEDTDGSASVGSDLTG